MHETFVEHQGVAGREPRCRDAHVGRLSIDQFFADRVEEDGTGTLGVEQVVKSFGHHVEAGGRRIATAVAQRKPDVQAPHLRPDEPAVLMPGGSGPDEPSDDKPVERESRRLPEVSRDDIDQPGVDDRIDEIVE